MSDQTPVLLISYFFPPIGMAGSARMYGLFRYLPEFGYRPYVVTVRDIVYPAYDDTLLNETDERYIIRTESLDPSRMLRRLGKETAPVRGHGKHLPRWITPDYKRLWVPFALRAARRVVTEKNSKLALTTSPTPSAHLVGAKLQQASDIRWVADFRDMWVTRPIEDAYLRESQKTYCRKLLEGTRNNADAVVAVNDSIAKYVGAGAVIPNGVDPQAADLWGASIASDSVLRIGYLGTTDSAATITRFTIALSEALKCCGLNATAACVRFVGAVDTVMLQECFSRAGLAESLECVGYLPRQDAIKALADVDALLVTIPDELPFVTPSKVFDCLVSGKPLIALAPAGSELAKIVHGAGERVFADDGAASLTEYLSELLQAKKEHGVCREDATRMKLVQARREKYSWRQMARKMAYAFDDILDRRQGEL